MSNQIRNRLEYLKKHNLLDKHNVSASGSNELLVCDVIDEFTSSIPEHISAMPAFSNNGVTRNEMEWKALARTMAGEIIRLRKEN